MVELRIKIAKDKEDNNILCASLAWETDDEIIAGHGTTPYDALRDLINEMEYQYQYFRAD